MDINSWRTPLAHYATANPQRAIAFGQRAIAIDPLLEDVHLKMMQCYHRLNDRAAVARQYQQSEQVLRDHLGIEPNDAAKVLYRELDTT